MNLSHDCSKETENDDYPVDSKQSNALVTQHIQKTREVESIADTLPPVSEDLNSLLYNLVFRLSLKKITSFDPDGGTSCFAFFSQLAWSEFVNRIQSEKRSLHQIAHERYAPTIKLKLQKGIKELPP